MSNKFAWHAPTFSDAIASVRIRCLQTMEELSRSGMHIERFEPSSSGSYQTVVFSKAYSVGDIELAARLRSQGVRVLFDICDNHVYTAHLHPALTQRALRLEKMLTIAQTVVASTHKLREYLSHYFPSVAERIIVIPDALDPMVMESDGTQRRSVADLIHLSRLKRFLTKKRPALSLVWFGNHGVIHAPSGMNDLLLIRDVLEHHARILPITLTVISNSYVKYLALRSSLRLPTCYLPWRRGIFKAALAQHDVAVLPVSLNPFTLPKTNNRPATALLAGLGVIADAIPSYEELNPFIWLNDWTNGLTAYYSDKDNEARRIADGKEFLVRKYSTSVVGRQWRNVLLGGDPGDEGGRETQKHASCIC